MTLTIVLVARTTRRPEIQTTRLKAAGHPFPNACQAVQCGRRPGLRCKQRRDLRHQGRCEDIQDGATVIDGFLSQVSGEDVCQRRGGQRRGGATIPVLTGKRSTSLRRPRRRFSRARSCFNRFERKSRPRPIGKPAPEPSTGTRRSARSTRKVGSVRPSCNAFTTRSWRTSSTNLHSTLTKGRSFSSKCVPTT